MSAAARPFRFAGRVYAIVDTAVRGKLSAVELAESLLAGGVRLLQLRAKDLSTRDFCELASRLCATCRQHSALFMVNDRADIAALVGADGVHLGQTDLPPDDARRILGERAVIGFSTHNLSQFEAADRLESVDYLAFGPIFPTSSKLDADPCQGLDGLRVVRAATSRPLVAIGGIGAATASEVLGAGADAVAMIGALAAAEDPATLVRGIEAGRAPLSS